MTAIRSIILIRFSNGESGLRCFVCVEHQQNHHLRTYNRQGHKDCGGGGGGRGALLYFTDQIFTLDSAVACLLSSWQ